MQAVQAVQVVVSMAGLQQVSGCGDLYWVGRAHPGIAGLRTDCMRWETSSARQAWQPFRGPWSARAGIGDRPLHRR